jgi:hypothetical protein
MHLYYNSWENNNVSNKFKNNYKLYIDNLYDEYIKSYEFIQKLPIFNRVEFLKSVKDKSIRLNYLEKDQTPTNLRFILIDNVIWYLYSKTVSKITFKKLLKL